MTASAEMTVSTTAVRREGERRQTRAGGYVGSIVVNAILLFVAHNLLTWNVPFVTASWSDVLWAVHLTLEATIVGGAICLLFQRGLATSSCRGWSGGAGAEQGLLAVRGLPIRLRLRSV